MPKVMLLAAGLGTRLRPLTERVPKCLVPIGGRPLLDHWRTSFERHGVRDVVVNVHAHADQVHDWVRRSNAAGPIRWVAVDEPELLGSAGTIRENLDLLEDDGPDFLVVYADNLSAVDLASLVRAHRERGAVFTAALFETSAPAECGIATLGADGRIVEFVEKPASPASNLANAGIYVVGRGVLHDLLDESSFDMGFDVMPQLVGRMHGWVSHDYHRDIRDAESLARAEDDLAGGRVRVGGARATG